MEADDRDRHVLQTIGDYSPDALRRLGKKIKELATLRQMWMPERAVALQTIRQSLYNLEHGVGFALITAEMAHKWQTAYTYQQAGTDILPQLNLEGPIVCLDPHYADNLAGVHLFKRNDRDREDMFRWKSANDIPANRQGAEQLLDIVGSDPNNYWTLVDWLSNLSRCIRNNPHEWVADSLR